MPIQVAQCEWAGHVVERIFWMPSPALIVGDVPDGVSASIREASEEDVDRLWPRLSDAARAEMRTGETP